MCREEKATTQAEKAREETLTPHFFKGAQQRMAPPLVPFSSGTMNTSTPSVQLPSCGMGERSACEGTSKGGSSSSTASQFASALIQSVGIHS